VINGARLRQAREARAFSQTALADAVGIDQSSIAHFEAGRAHPSETVLGDLALHLGFAPAYFRQPDPPQLPLGSLLYRARTRLSAAGKLQAHRTAELAYEIALLLDEQASPTNTVPRPEGLAPGAAAELARSALGVSPRGPITSLVAVLENGGVWLLPLPIDLEGHDAFSAWASGQTPVIAITGMAIPPDRLNFSLAHELGHLVLHRSPSGTRRGLEREADDFAGSFLVPDDDARADLLPPLTPAKLAYLKVKWHVSMQALLHRASQVGMISEETYVQTMKQFSRRGWRKTEPYSRSLARQWPARWRGLAERKYGQPLPYKRLAAETNTPLKVARWLLAEDRSVGSQVTRSSVVLPFRPREDAVS
jgi:Zn-dependent peptidase ImmA (M78 family)/DNA-binding XRE family transcriptional regulator